MTALGQRAAPEPPPDLAAVIDAWPTLPEAIRAGIVAMVKAAAAVPTPRNSDGSDDSPRRPRKGGGR